MPKPKFTPGSSVVFKVKNRSGKKPLAGYLASRLGVVDAWAADLIAQGAVRLDGAVARAGDLINLSAGPHEIEVAFPLAWPRHMAATPMDLAILHEDSDLVAVDKPPGVVVHPARGHLDNQTIQNGMRHRYRHLLGREGVTIGPPHRLDKDTSGVLLFSLTTHAYIDLAGQFADGRTAKEYWAIVDGVPEFDEIRCEEPIGPDPDAKGRGRVCRPGEGGKTARTDFTVLERGCGWALLQARPKTGRPHQIRIHAASLGLPIAGDGEYNPFSGGLGIARQALHAASLRFHHPADGRPVSVSSPLPDDMRQALERLRGKDGIKP